MGQARHIVSALAILLLLAAGSAVTVPVARHLLAERSFEKTITEKGGTCGNGSSPPLDSKLLPGRNLFAANCATCHGLDKNITGPALRGVETRGPWADRKKLIRWVKDPAAMIPKYTYTKALVNEYNGQIMPGFPKLSNEEINAIFDFVTGAPSLALVVPTVR